jgi:hypothetical protein
MLREKHSGVFWKTFISMSVWYTKHTININLFKIIIPNWYNNLKHLRLEIEFNEPNISQHPAKKRTKKIEQKEKLCRNKWLNKNNSPYNKCGCASFTIVLLRMNVDITIEAPNVTAPKRIIQIAVYPPPASILNTQGLRPPAEYTFTLEINRYATATWRECVQLKEQPSWNSFYCTRNINKWLIHSNCIVGYKYTNTP